MPALALDVRGLQSAILVDHKVERDRDRIPTRPFSKRLPAGAGDAGPTAVPGGHDRHRHHDTSEVSRTSSMRRRQFGDCEDPRLPKRIGSLDAAGLIFQRITGSERHYFLALS